MNPRHVIARVAIAAALATPLANASPVAAQDEHIIAVINDDVVSRYDLEQGVKLALLFFGLEGTPDEMRRLVPQVLRRLVDQRLFFQEGARFNISISDSDLDRQIARLDKSDTVAGVSLKRRLKDKGISLDALRNQVRSELIWGELVRRRGLRAGLVTDEEVEEEIEQIKASRGTPEYRASEIFLVVESIDEDPEVRRNARRMVEQIRSGSSFSGLARQFSNGSTAARGGDMGWVRGHQLAEEVVAALEALEPGEVSDPIRSNGGYLILILRERRKYMVANPDDATVTLKQLLLPLPAGASEDEIRVSLALAETIRSTVADCDDISGVAAELDPSASGDPIVSRIGDLRSNVRQSVRDMPVGSIGAPERTEAGVLLFMVCERVEPEVPLPDRTSVRRRLREIKLEPVRRRYHRDLLRAAYRDIRI
jgi:peptidyl-prolyl cis-trans isomerase SurA